MKKASLHDRAALAICARRFRELKLVIEDNTASLDAALKIYRHLRKYPAPPKDLNALSEDNQISLLVWRTYQLRFGYPLQDLLAHGLTGLVPNNVQATLLGRNDLLGIGVPFRTFVSELPFERLLQAIPKPATNESAIRAVAGRMKKPGIGNVYDHVSSKFAARGRLQDSEAEHFAAQLRRYGIVIDPFIA